jgi:hypothetical protein
MGSAVIRFVLVFAFCSVAFAQPALVQQASNGGNSAPSGSTLTVTLTSSPSSSNVLIATLSSVDTGGSYASTITSLDGASWTQVCQATNDSNSDAEVWVGTSPSSSTVHVFTAANVSAPSVTNAQISEWSGLSSTSDKTNMGTGQSGTVATGSITTTNANDAIFAAAGNNGAVSTGPGTGWTSFTFSYDQNHAGAYQVVSSTGTYSATWSWGGNNIWSACIAALKASTAVRVCGTLALLGVGC